MPRVPAPRLIRGGWKEGASRGKEESYSKGIERMDGGRSHLGGGRGGGGGGLLLSTWLPLAAGRLKLHLTLKLEAATPPVLLQ